MEVILEGERSYFRVYFISSGSNIRVVIRFTGSNIRGLYLPKKEAILEYMEVILEWLTAFSSDLMRLNLK